MTADFIAPGWTPLHAAVHQTLRDRDLLLRQQRILIAVSGGQDSLCLARVLLDLQPKWMWDLAIAHCDHCWRSDSAANADFVKALAQTWHLPYFQATAASPPASESAARTWRYQQLTAIAQQHGYGVVVTGHTASDRAETLLFNLVRGSGMDGLQALTWQRPLAPGVMLVRPLLGLTRQQTGDFCQQQQLPIWEDSTNHDRHYARNRLRLEVLPYLRTQFNPQVDTTLAQTAELLQAEVEFLEQAATDWFQRSQVESRLSRDCLRSAPLALQRRVVRQFLAQQLAIQPTFAQVEKVVKLLTAPNRSQTDPFPGGAIAQVNGDWIELRS